MTPYPCSQHPGEPEAMLAGARATSPNSDRDSILNHTALDKSERKQTKEKKTASNKDKLGFSHLEL